MEAASSSRLSERLTAAFVLIAVTLFGIFFAPAWLFIGVVEAFTLAGLYEYFTIAEKKGVRLNKALGLFYGALLAPAAYLPGEPLILVIAILSLFVYNFHRNLKDQALVSSAVTLFGIVYVAWTCSFLVRIRQLPNGALWVFFTIFVTKMGDTAAFFVGRAFGRHKMVEHISPRKSVEGAVASFVASVVSAVALKAVLHAPPLAHLLALGVLIGILGQLGDLAESLIKRDAGVKDSGAIPGLGGVLDVMDSLLFTIPVVYAYATTFYKILA